MKLDYEKCYKAMEQIYVEGNPIGGVKRPALIEEAIRLIQENPEEAMLERFLAYKNYAAFGDQRTDCEYGYGPKHGYIVFSIGRNREFKGTLDTDACIYLLLAVLDFEIVYRENPNSSYRRNELNLCSVLQKLKNHKEIIEEFEEEINLAKEERLKEFTV
jgi:hypothetical protein